MFNSRVKVNVFQNDQENIFKLLFQVFGKKATVHIFLDNVLQIYYQTVSFIESNF